MTITRAIHPSKLNRPRLANLAYFNPTNTILLMDKDRKTFYGASNQTLYYSINADTSATPTWTAITTITGTSRVISGMMSTPDGEVLLALTTSGVGSDLYKSTGWNFGAGRATATFAIVLSTIGGLFYNNYCMHGFNVGKNGVVVVSEGGTQTAGGSGNVTTDLAKARRVWLSKDFGATFAQIFDIYTYGQSQGIAYPGGVHIHGVSYDEDWDRIWVCYGDGTGDGKNIAGIGNIQVVYSDDGGLTWVKMPTPNLWSNGGTQLSQTLQFIVGIPLAQAVLFTPDVTKPEGVWVYPKVGYREFGEPLQVGYLGSGTSFVVRKVEKDSSLPLFFGGQISPITQTGNVYARLLITEDNGFSWHNNIETIPLQSPALTQYGYADCFGPTVNGKLVLLATHSINNDSTKKYIQADYISGNDGQSETGGKATIADGATIAHGLPYTPREAFAQATVKNRSAVVTAADAINITVALTDLTGVAITVAESVRWTARI